MNSWIIAGIILLIGILFFIFLYLRSKWLQNPSHIKDYEEGRNKTTFRKKKEEKVDDSCDSTGFFPDLTSLITGIVTLAIVILIGTTILSSLSTTLEDSSIASNVSFQAAESIGQLSSFFPVFLAVAVSSVILMLICSFIKYIPGIY